MELVDIVGGQLIRPGSPYYETIQNWIAGGVELDLTTPRVTGIQIQPQNPVVQRIGERQQLTLDIKQRDGRGGINGAGRRSGCRTR